LIAALSACDDVLEVELPHLLTDAAIADPATAELQVNSGIALFECGYSSFGQIAGGFEDMWDPQAGNFRLYALYNESPTSGNCDATDLNISFFDQFAGARALLSNDPDLMTPSGKSVTAVGSAQGVYDRLQGEWDLGADGERLSAIGAIYVAASLAVMGEFFCEAAIDGSDLMTPPEVLDVADQWVDRALTHIGAYGENSMGEPRPSGRKRRGDCGVDRRSGVRCLGYTRHRTHTEEQDSPDRHGSTLVLAAGRDYALESLVL
jgi:hypothetical protein